MLLHVRSRTGSGKLQAVVATLTATILSSSFGITLAQSSNESAPSSFPKVYPGQPSGDFSPAWQSYFEVTAALPNITGAAAFSSAPLARSFAGNLPVNRAGHPNDTLFFWGFESQNGSLTRNATDGSEDPWFVWLQGGPGSSSLAGLLLENGPIRIQDDLSMRPNNFTWASLADGFWVDDPVGVGFATADSLGYVLDDDQMGEDFVGFLSNLVKVFPSLATRPLILAGESYAGRWVPYATKALFSTENPPVKLHKIAVGDGTVSEFPVSQDAAVVTLIETYPQIVSYDEDVLTYFREQTHLCGFDINLTYPQQGGTFPTLEYTSPSDPASPFFFEGTINPATFAQSRLSRLQSTTLDARSLDKRTPSAPLTHRQRRRAVYNFARCSVGMHKREFEELTELERARELYRREWIEARMNKRDLTGRGNGTIDSWYGCFILDELYDYMSNFTVPWNANPNVLDVYDMTDGLVVKPATDPSQELPPVFFQDNRTIAALHAPTSKLWEESINYPFNGSFTLGDQSADPQDFMNELAANASNLGVGIVFYSGNDDSLLPHHGTEIGIQNTTWGGIQGFSRKPSTPWFDDSGAFAGIVHQERNLTYVLFQGASHLVPQKVPAAALVFFREFILGSNTTGLVVNDTSGGASVVGGEVSSLAGDFLPGASGIFEGSISTTATLVYPAATVSAWDAFVASLAAGDAAATSSAAAANTKTNAANVKAGVSLGSITLSVTVVVLAGVSTLLHHF